MGSARSQIIGKEIVEAEMVCHRLEMLPADKFEFKLEWGINW